MDVVQDFYQVLDWQQQSQSLLQNPIYALVLLTLIFVVGYVVTSFRVKKIPRDSVLILGNVDAGKTALFSRLILGRFSPTFTSIEVNEEFYRAKSKKSSSPTLRIVDIPGHRKLRNQYRQELQRTIAVLFCLDSVTIPKDPRPVAEYLFEVLLERRKCPSFTPPILLVCTKRDAIGSYPPERIQSILEKELELVQQDYLNMRQSGLLAESSIDASTNKSNEFSPLVIDFKQLRIDLVSTTCIIAPVEGSKSKKSGSEISEVEAFLKKLRTL